MGEPPELGHVGHWRLAVRALRVGFFGLAVAVVGIIVLSTGSTPWVLAAGVVIWLASAAITVTGVVRARGTLPAPRPGWWSLRFMLIRESVRSGSPAPRS